MFRFVDDVALIATSVNVMEVQLNELNQGTYTKETTVYDQLQIGRNYSGRHYRKGGQVQVPRSNCDDGEPNTRRSYDQDKHDKGRMELFWQIQIYIYSVIANYQFP